MKNSFLTQSFLLLLFLTFTATSFAKNSNKSFLISASVPVIAGVYSWTIDDTEGVKELALASLVTLQLTTFLKNTVQRTRPNGENDLSFPSGHASGAFTGASYMHHRYGLRWGLPLYAIAGVIGYQRVNVKDHYWSDVIAGAVLGYVSGALFTVKYPNVWLEPKVDSENRSVGMQLKMRY